MRYFLFLLFLAGALSGCSSLPDRTAAVPKEVTSGMELLRQARLSARMNRPDHALTEAQKAYRYFALVDDLEGLFYANLELGKLYRQTDPQKSRAYLQDAEKITEVFKPELTSIYRLRLAELKFLENDFAQTLSLMKNLQFDDGAEVLAAEVCAYQIMASLKLKTDAADAGLGETAQELAELYERLRDRYEDYEMNDPEAVSFSAYVLGLLAASKKSWAEAERWFQAAWEIDRQIGNYSGTAENLYSLGVVNKSLGRRALAQGFFERAARIFETLEKPARAKACHSAIDALK